MRHFIAREVDWKPYLIFDCVAMTDDELELKKRELSGNEIIPGDEVNDYSRCRAGVSLYKLAGRKLVLREEKEFVQAEREERERVILDEIACLKKRLGETDWAVVKCSELCLTLQEVYPTLATERTALRQGINEKETEIETLNNTRYEK